ncbi:MAG: hypothetical protein AB7S26_30170 [Sandaracinaceae bacterium]
MRKISVGLVMGALAFGAGCVDTSEPDPFVDPGRVQPEATVALVDAPIHRGTMGAVVGFDGHVTRTEGYDYGGYADIHVVSTDPDAGGAAMSLLSFQGSLDSPELVPGAHLTFTLDGDGIDFASSELYISLVGCSGDSDQMWDFDEQADTVVVDVLESANPDVHVLHYVGTWRDGHTVEGEVHYELR